MIRIKRRPRGRRKRRKGTSRGRQQKRGRTRGAHFLPFRLFLPFLSDKQPSSLPSFQQSSKQSMGRDLRQVRKGEDSYWLLVSNELRFLERERKGTKKLNVPFLPSLLRFCPQALDQKEELLHLTNLQERLQLSIVLRKLVPPVPSNSALWNERADRLLLHVQPRSPSPPPSSAPKGKGKRVMDSFLEDLKRLVSPSHLSS